MLLQTLPNKANKLHIFSRYHILYILRQTFDEDVPDIVILAEIKGACPFKVWEVRFITIIGFEGRILKLLIEYTIHK